MATRKGSSAKKASAKSVRKAPVKKRSAKKASAKRKSTLDPTKTIKGFPGLDEHFYPKFPRFDAYRILISAPKKQMQIGKFLDKIEALPNVANRKQAMGIVQKLLTKHKSPCGATFAKYA